MPYIRMYIGDDKFLCDIIKIMLYVHLYIRTYTVRTYTHVWYIYACTYVRISGIDVAP